MSKWGSYAQRGFVKIKSIRRYLRKRKIFWWKYLWFCHLLNIYRRPWPRSNFFKPTKCYFTRIFLLLLWASSWTKIREKRVSKTQLLVLSFLSNLVRKKKKEKNILHSTNLWIKLGGRNLWSFLGYLPSFVGRKRGKLARKPIFCLLYFIYGAIRVKTKEFMEDFL